MFRLLIFSLILLIFGCNPVKKVLNDQKKFDIVAKEVVKRGYCINDTVIIDSIKIDTVYKEHYFIDTLTINKSNLDTLTPNGVKIIIKDSFISVKCPPSKNIVKTVKQIQYIRDKKFETILKEELILKSDSLKQNALILKEQSMKINQSKIKIAKEKGKFIILMIAIISGFAIYIVSKFKLL